MKQPHINCNETQISDNVIICGDPSRVERIATLGKNPRFISTNREYTVYETEWNNSKVTVCSTGIGAPSALIAIEELSRCGAKKIVRVGSAGALQQGIKLGKLLLAEGAIRCDGGSSMYIEKSYPAISDFELFSNMQAYLKNNRIEYQSGLIYSHDSFYTDNEAEFCRKWSSAGVLGADMETAGILTLGRLRKIKVASILNIVVEYEADLEQGINDYRDADSIVMNGERSASLAAFHAFL